MSSTTFTPEQMADIQSLVTAAVTAALAGSPAKKASGPKPKRKQGPYGKIGSWNQTSAVDLDFTPVTKEQAKNIVTMFTEKAALPKPSKTTQTLSEVTYQTWKGAKSIGDLRTIMADTGIKGLGFGALYYVAQVLDIDSQLLEACDGVATDRSSDSESKKKSTRTTTGQAAYSAFMNLMRESSDDLKGLIQAFFDAEMLTKADGTAFEKAGAPANNSTFKLLSEELQAEWKAFSIELPKAAEKDARRTVINESDDGRALMERSYAALVSFAEEKGLVDVDSDEE